jgi:hypothetical protein
MHTLPDSSEKSKALRDRPLDMQKIRPYSGKNPNWRQAQAAIRRDTHLLRLGHYRSKGSRFHSWRERQQELSDFLRYELAPGRALLLRNQRGWMR